MFRRVSFLGSTRVVLAVSVVAAGLSWRRCPGLAVAILIIALTRPLAEWGLKELVSRDRPFGDAQRCRPSSTPVQRIVERTGRYETPPRR